MFIAKKVEPVFERKLKFSTKPFVKGQIVSLIDDAEIFADQLVYIRTEYMKSRYEKSLIIWTQKLNTCACVLDEEDFMVVDSWTDPNYGTMYLIEGTEGLVFVTTRPNLVEVDVIAGEELDKQVTFINAKNKDIFLFQLADMKIKVTRDSEDKFDFEKAALYAMLKMTGKYGVIITHEEVLEFVKLAKEAHDMYLDTVVTPLCVSCGDCDGCETKIKTNKKSKKSTV